MWTADYREIEQTRVEAEGAVGVRIRWLIDDSRGAPNFALREFEIDPGGHTPYHSHPWEHEVFILAGQGVSVDTAGRHRVGPGSVVYVAPGEEHNFVNDGDEILRFLCIIPHHD